MNLAYGLYMAETEGLLDTHESKMQKMLKDIQTRYVSNNGNFKVPEGYIESFGLTFEELTGHDLVQLVNMATKGHL